jgi:hypothetical protein
MMTLTWIHLFRCLKTVVLGVALFISTLYVAESQTSQATVDIKGEDDAIVLNISKPDEILAKLNLKASEIQQKLLRVRIAVSGAGAVRDDEFVSPTGTVYVAVTKVEIVITGDDDRSVLDISSFTDDSKQLSTKPNILVTGAGTVRELELDSP